MVVDTSVIEHPESCVKYIWKVAAITSDHINKPTTYDHRTLKTRLPVRSALFKQRTGGLVVRWVTTSEYPLLYVFEFLVSVTAILQSHHLWVRTAVFLSEVLNPSLWIGCLSNATICWQATLNSCLAPIKFTRSHYYSAAWGTLPSTVYDLDSTAADLL